MSAGAAAPARDRHQGRRIATAYVWATIGAIAVVVQAYVYASWLLSPDLVPAPLGPDPVPPSDKMWAWILQPLFVAAGLAATLWIVRGCIRAGRFTFDAKLWCAFMSLAWLDTVANFTRPVVAFNAYYVNLGSWNADIPGWMSAGVRRFPSTFLIEFPSYMFLALVPVAGCAFLRALSKRWPRLGPIRLLGCWWLVAIVFMVAFEEPLARAGWLIWIGGNVPGLTLWPGTRYQLPLLLDPILWGGPVLTAVTALRYYRDDRGRCWVERGLDTVSRLAPRVGTAMSTLAVIGFATVGMVIYAVGGTVVAQAHTVAPPGMPSYMRAGLCQTDADAC
ncbi:spirocyclase AveC family protein [Mycobacterium palustre]|uniref:DUF5135 domain-containing protein n=1 Tax=Mycobacterium palustre TaxID=153971 RepID=A0A1X1ZQ14_9MYCO|nr:spirocyclase AveC family protein [Mycobacterium palustre]MCV7103568.1 spirocyclase AveC family protein [Mycobacterium palustre]ORW25494.1 hypothetical protein AWC19_06975 [Mycobacterium palustre]